MNITLRQLEIFCAIARRNHVSRAAEDASISQSAASMALAELERQLGVRLFDRFGKKLVLNDHGRTLFPKAIDLLARAHEIEPIFRSPNKVSGHLKVGASSTIGNYLMPGVLARFATEEPAIRIALQVGNTKQIIQSVLDCEVDLGCIEGPCNEPNIETQIWRSDELIVFVSPEHPLAGQSKISRSSLAASQWVLREKGSGTRSVFERAAEGNLGNLNICYELGHSEAIKRAIKGNLGVSCLSRLALQEELDAGTLVELPTPFLSLHRTLSLVLRKEKYPTQTLHLFLDFLIHPHE